MYLLNELISDNEDQFIILRSLYFDDTGMEIKKTEYNGLLKEIPEEFQHKYVYSFWYSSEKNVK